MAVSDILTQRGKMKYEFEGCMFTFDAHNADFTKKFWRSDQRNNGCRARIHTDVVTNQVGSRVLHFVYS